MFIGGTVMKLIFWQKLLYSASVGAVCAICSIFLRAEYVALVYFVGVLYSFFGYIILEWCIGNLGSLACEEDEMPRETSLWMHALVMIWPATLIIGLYVIGGIFTGAWLKYKYDRVIGHIKTD